jgi:hypothetical protein
MGQAGRPARVVCAQSWPASESGQPPETAWAAPWRGGSSKRPTQSAHRRNVGRGARAARSRTAAHPGLQRFLIDPHRRPHRPTQALRAQGICSVPAREGLRGQQRECKVLRCKAEPATRQGRRASLGIHGPDREVFKSLLWTDLRGQQIKLDLTTRAVSSRPRRDAETDIGT